MLKTGSMHDRIRHLVNVNSPPCYLVILIKRDAGHYTPGPIHPTSCYPSKYLLYFVYIFSILAYSSCLQLSSVQPLERGSMDGQYSRIFVFNIFRFICSEDWQHDYHRSKRILQINQLSSRRTFLNCCRLTVFRPRNLVSLSSRASTEPVTCQQNSPQRYLLYHVIFQESTMPQH